MRARLTVNRLFSEQTVRNPDAMALTCGGTQLSYRILDNCANYLARRLVGGGVNPGDNVVLCMPRSVESVVATLAVLKAGAAFVPLDPSLPEALRRDYLSQSAAHHVIVASGDESSLASEPDLAPISAGDFLDARDIEADDVEASRGAEMPIYIMFTSGATGKPMGVVVPHRGVVRLVCDTDYVKLGCLRFMPGTHEQMFYDESKKMAFDPSKVNALERDGIKRGFFGYDSRGLQKDSDRKPDESKAVSLEMQPRQRVTFWPTLMHSSFPNSTKHKTRLGYASRYVPASVRVYPDTDVVDEYGSQISLNKYGVVPVSGEDHFSHSRRVDRNMRGSAFAPSTKVTSTV
jgi:hypothetical protein